MNKRYFLGVDPGWKNLGWALCDENFSLVATGVLVPASIEEAGYGLTPDAIAVSIKSEVGEVNIVGACMERYVTYKGKHNPASEQILMVTGQLQYWLNHLVESDYKMFRAYDWKSSLLRYLHKNKGFHNPVQDLDKEFSMAAASYCFDTTFKTDHEADAACLSYIACLLHTEK